MSVVHNNNRMTMTSVLDKRSQEIQNNVREAGLNTKNHSSIATMTEAEIKNLINIKTNLAVCNKNIEIAKYCEGKFSAAMTSLDNISNKASQFNGILAGNANLDPSSRNIMNNEIDNILSMIQQELRTSYHNQDLFDSEAKNVKLSSSITVNTSIDSNNPSINNLIKVLKDIKNEVNDVTVNSISSNLTQKFANAQTELGTFLVNVQKRQENAANAIEANENSITSFASQFEELMTLNPLIQATIVDENMKELSFINMIQPAVNRVLERSWGN